jgi:signal transduction histidine kinase
VSGTGMGLAIVQQIAQAHGGTLSVSSETDAGTTFTLSLPFGGHQK